MRAVLAALLTTLALSATPAASARIAPTYVAVLDPGHGGEHDGAIGPTGAKEKDLALEITRRVAARLRRQGALVLLTRERDEALELPARAALANQAEADVFVSIHLNSMATRAARGATHGVETYFLSADASDASANAVAARENADRLAGTAPDPANPVSAILDDLWHVEALAESSRLAHALHARLVSSTGAENRGVKQAPFVVLAGARMPSVLVEVGFVSHDTESRRLSDPAYQERIAAGIAEGIASFRAGLARASRP
ncbi:MAG TPA: N-acetylmuramoyl-L-alanine amidase [Anaeromyxobacteraceae bacterium]|nr:N-acetylmuramoyl-L-alanine amidase [Anaeromyxobacteraceae bacterium]